MKAFGEFFNNQIEYATTVILSRSQNATPEQLEFCVKQIQALNPKASVITTDWDAIKGEQILKTMEGQDNLEMKVLAEARHAQDEAEHHHHHDHHHEGEDCGHACNACSEEKCKDENLALLTYMLQHNEHHAAELDEMADKLEKAGMADAAKQIREGVSDFQKGNMRLSLALTLVKEHLKEVK